MRFAANRRSVGSAAPVRRAARQAHGAGLTRPPVAQAHANASTLEITEPLDQWSSAMRTPVWGRAACRCNPSFRSHLHALRPLGVAFPFEERRPSDYLRPLHRARRRGRCVAAHFQVVAYILAVQLGQPGQSYIMSISMVAIGRAGVPAAYGMAEYLRVAAGVTYLGSSAHARRELGFGPRGPALLACAASSPHQQRF